MKDEARIMVQLNHPNIVSLIEFGKVDHDYYISMEYIEGTTMRGLIKRVQSRSGMFTIDMATHLVREVATGLSYAHRKLSEEGKSLDIVHRDISPANILVSFDGQVKITDFGISKASTQSHFTQTGIIRGKTGYMSPEQTRSDIEIDRRSDLFSLGVIFYELLTGKKLFYAKSIPEAIRLVREGEVPPIAAFRSDVPPALEKIVRKILENDPNDRYQRAEEFIDAINEFLTKFSPAGRTVRITHLDLIGFMKRFFEEEMSAIEEAEEQSLISEALSSVSDADVDSSDTFGDTSTFANNPRFAISAPIDRPNKDVALISTQRSKQVSGTALEEAISGKMAISKSMGQTEIDSKFFWTSSFTSFTKRVFTKPTPWIATAAVALVLTIFAFVLRSSNRESFQWIQVDSEPPAAQVWVDGVLQESRTPGRYKISSNQDLVRVQIFREGYKLLDQTRRASDFQFPITFSPRKRSESKVSSYLKYRAFRCHRVS